MIFHQPRLLLNNWSSLPKSYPLGNMVGKLHAVYLSTTSAWMLNAMLRRISNEGEGTLFHLKGVVSLVVGASRWLWGGIFICIYSDVHKNNLRNMYPQSIYIYSISSLNLLNMFLINMFQSKTCMYCVLIHWGRCSWQPKRKQDVFASCNSAQPCNDGAG